MDRHLWSRCPSASGQQVGCTEFKDSMKNPTLVFLLIALALHGSNGFAQTNSAPLLSAAKKGDAVAIKQAIASGINVDAIDQDGQIALIVAASNGKLDAVKV